MVLRASDPLPAGPIFIETFYFNQAFEGEVLEPCEKHASSKEEKVAMNLFCPHIWSLPRTVI